jgi:hypothetical protein
MNTAKVGIALVAAGVAFIAVRVVRAADATAESTTTSTTTTTTTAPVAAPSDPATTPPAPAQRGMTLPGATPEPAVETTDHAAVVRRFGVGYMGRRTMIVGPAAEDQTDAPIIGARYWLDPRIGIDAGIGLLFSGGSTKLGDTSTDLQGYTVFMLHGGVPLALAGSKHFSFQIVPELNFGISGSKTAPATAGGQGSDMSGIHFDIGARAGGEIQFGFIGIPELSLQAGVGLAFSYDHGKLTPPGGGAASSVNRSSFGTSVGNNPWNIFTSNIAALYYF